LPQSKKQMEVTGKLVQVTIPEEVTMKNGNTFIKCHAILETEGNYPKKIAVNLPKTELIEKLTKLKLGEIVTISVNVESKEFNGKWFTEVKGWKI
jgi:hypothetical protein